MRIGIILTGDYSWAGGVYYSLNIIKLLQKLSLEKNIQLVVLINKSTERGLLEELKLKNVELVSLDDKSFLYKAWCKLAGFITGMNVRFINDINALKLDVLYPVIQYERGHEKLNCRVFYWLFDFQHKFLPALFSKEELEKRDANFYLVTEKAKDIVVSSYDSKNHLIQFYPSCTSTIHVYNFVSLITDTARPISPKIPQDYMVVCNQFWPHKNHLTVLKAIANLVKKGKQIHVVFTGKYDGTSNQTYVADLRNFITINQLESYVTFTGFIAREDQVALISKAKAVIQPSLFEGWSTVIEDAKALNKFLIASALPIHKEQIHSEVLFFSPEDSLKLSEMMDEVFQKEMIKTKTDYTANIERSLTDLQKLLGIR